MVRFRMIRFGIAVLSLCVVAVALGCPQQQSAGPEAVPGLQADDTTATSPVTPPIEAPGPEPLMLPTQTLESAPTHDSTTSKETGSTSTFAAIPPECIGRFPTNTPDPNLPEGIRGMGTQTWYVSSFQEAACITGYPISVPTNLPDGFIRSESIVVAKRGSEHIEERSVWHSWYIPGDPSYGFRLEEHSLKIGLLGGEPAIINGIPGERRLRPEQPPEFPPLLTLLWEEGGHWYKIMGFLQGPITEEFLLEVAASLQVIVYSSR